MANFCGEKSYKPIRKGDPIPWQAVQIEQLPLASLKPDPGNPRKHDRKQIAKLVVSMGEFGFTNPILIDEGGAIIAGHGRLLAAEQLGLKTAPCIRLNHLTASQKKAYGIADNAMSDDSRWDGTALRAVLVGLGEVNFDLSLTALDTGAIDFHLDGPAGSGLTARTPSIHLIRSNCQSAASAIDGA